MRQTREHCYDATARRAGAKNVQTSVDKWLTLRAQSKLSSRAGELRLPSRMDEDGSSAAQSGSADLETTA